MAQIYILNIKNFSKKDIYENMNLVSINRQNKIKKYKFSSDAYRCLAGALIIRYALCEKLGCRNKDLNFDTTKYGKPFLRVHDNKKVHFNLSHSGEYIVCVIDDTECGIDVESTINYNCEIVENFFHPQEILQLEKIINIEDKKKYFSFLWTMKEAYVKALGVGLSKPLSSFHVFKNRENILINESDNQSKIFTVYRSLTLHDKYTLSFVGNSDISDIIFMDNTEFNFNIKKLKNS